MIGSENQFSLTRVASISGDGGKNGVHMDSGSAGPALRWTSEVLRRLRPALARGVKLIGHVLVAAGVVQANRTMAQSAQSVGSVFGWGNQVIPYVQPGTGFKAIAAGSAHSLALKDDGTVVGWGLNNCGQAAVPSGLTGVVAMAGGRSLEDYEGDYFDAAYSLALKQDGTVEAWGTMWGSSRQSIVPPGLSGVVAIAAGGDHALALKQNGTVVA